MNDSRNREYTEIPISTPMVFSGNISNGLEYFAINRQSKVMQFFGSIKQLRDSLAGNLDSDWDIYKKTTYVNELQEKEREYREAIYLKNIGNCKKGNQ